MSTTINLKNDAFRDNIFGISQPALRSSSLYCLFSSSCEYRADGTNNSNYDYEKWDDSSVSSSATLPYVTVGGYSKTKVAIPYAHGMTYLIMMGFGFDTYASGAQRVGAYGDYDGVFLEQAGSISLVRRSNGSDNSVAQSSWNLDKLDGTGISGKTLDLTKFQTLVIERSGLTSAEKVGFLIDGQVFWAHQFLAENTLATTLFYCKNIQLKYETTGSSVFQVWSAVFSDGPIVPCARTSIYSSSFSSVGPSTVDAVIFQASASGNNQYVFVPWKFNVAGLSCGQIMHWELWDVLNFTTGTSWSWIGNGSAIRMISGPAGVSPNKLLATGSVNDSSMVSIPLGEELHMFGLPANRQLLVRFVTETANCAGRFNVELKEWR